MAIIHYRAKFAIANGHSIGGDYTFDFLPSVLTPSQKTIESRSVSLSGVTQSVVDRREKIWAFESTYLIEGSPAYLNMYEFLESVDESEHFTVDVEGRPGQETFTQRAIKEGNYTRRRHEQSNDFTFTFRIRILP